MTRDNLTYLIGSHMSDRSVCDADFDNAWPVVDSDGIVISIYDSDDLSGSDLVGVIWMNGRIVEADEGFSDGFAARESIRRSSIGGAA